MPSIRFHAVFVVVMAVLLGGCATYSDNVKEAQDAVKYGENGRAVTRIHEALDLESVSALPTDFTGENPSLLLERATLLQ